MSGRSLLKGIAILLTITAALLLMLDAGWFDWI